MLLSLSQWIKDLCLNHLQATGPRYRKKNSSYRWQFIRAVLKVV